MTSSRRQFFTSTTAALAMLPLATVGLSACSSSNAAESAFSDDELKRQMLGKLEAELKDAEVAPAIMAHLLDIGFTWDLPSMSATQINRIVAYGFGNRPNEASGNTGSNGENQAALPDPGPINELLADAVYQIYRINPVKIYAQWEIARFLVSKYRMSPVSIEPVIAPDGTITYLSTDGVAAAVVSLEGGAANMGKVAVVGHRDHAKRCIETSRLLGMDAYAVSEVSLPVAYDPQSGQAWTRQRDLYLVHDMYAQFAMLRSILIAQAYPNG